MKYTLAILILLASMQQALALDPPVPSAFIPTFIPMPPPQYDGTYKGKLVITNMPDYGVIRFICKAPGAVACTVHSWGECLVLLGPGTWANKDVLRHEMGHCAGWPSDHPDAR